ncbi:unnamed protein product [Penicillium pancosmium]
MAALIDTVGEVNLNPPVPEGNEQKTVSEWIPCGLRPLPEWAQSGLFYILASIDDGLPARTEAKTRFQAEGGKGPERESERKKNQTAGQFRVELARAQAHTSNAEPGGGDICRDRGHTPHGPPFTGSDRMQVLGCSAQTGSEGSRGGAQRDCRIISEVDSFDPP